MRGSTRWRGARMVLVIAAVAATLTGSTPPAYAAGAYQVYRLYNKVNGSHFYTLGDWEASNAVRLYPKVYVNEGPVYWAHTCDDPAVANDVPLYRFYNKANGSHFYTVSAEEKAYVEAHYSRTYRYEGVAYYVISDNSGSDWGGLSGVHRFYNKTNGSHFYTISAEEKAYVEAHYSDVYTYEGIAFYARLRLWEITYVTPAPSFDVPLAPSY